MKIHFFEKIAKRHHENVPRVAAIGSSAFYLLIVLEFFYMASPFATYFYSAYGPGLDWLGKSEYTAWLTRFVLPHIASQTTSPLLNSHTLVGFILLLLGLAGFALGAFRIYREKLGKGAIIQTGLYKFIRHPQYACLIIASFGTWLIWPRMLATIGLGFVLVLYISLAKSEEKRCELIDPSYREFRKNTGFFLPRFLEWPFRLIHKALSRHSAILYWPLLTILCLSAMIAMSYAARNWSTSQIQGVYSTSMATISIGNEPVAKIDKVLNIAKAESSVAKQLKDLKSGQRRLINYILPTDMYVSEVPSFVPEREITTHQYKNDIARTKFKIIFTEAALPPGDAPEGIDILRRALNKTPIVEVWVDLHDESVEKILPPPTNQYYYGMPVPVF